MDVTIYEEKIRDIESLISESLLYTTKAKEAEIAFDNALNLVENNIRLLNYFPSLDEDLASTINSISYAESLEDLHIEEILNKISELKSKIDNAEDLLEKVDRHPVRENVYNRDRVCSEVKDLIYLCKNELKLADLDRLLSEMNYSLRQLSSLLGYLNSDKALLNEEKSKLVQLLASISEYADRHGAKKVKRETQSVIDKIPSGSKQSDIDSIKRQVDRIEHVKSLFESEEIEALSVYSRVCSDPKAVWSDQLDNFKVKMKFVPKRQTCSQDRFDLEEFKTEAELLLAKKNDDIELFEKENSKLVKKFSDSLREEIKDAKCSYQDFIDWQERSRQIYKEKIKSNWKKTFTVIGYIIFSPIILVWLIIKAIYDHWDKIWPVLKVLLIAVGCVFYLVWIVISTIFRTPEERNN